MSSCTRNLLILFALIPLYAFGGESIPIHLEYAVTYQERTKGLMERPHLPPNNGMLFSYETPQPISIWMYQTLIDLSVAFLDEEGIIKEIHELKAYPQIKDPNFFHEKGVSASFDASYALEMNQGWFTKHGVKPGDKVYWEENSAHGLVIKQN